MSKTNEKPKRVVAPVVWHATDDGFERAVVFEPGYNLRHLEGYGVHGMGIRFLLRGPKGATQFLMNCGWVPGEKMPASLAEHFPSGSYLGYHARRPQYEGASDGSRACEWLGGGTCYYDGSGVAADDVLTAFIAEGEPAVWRTLREWYDRLDEEAE